MISKSPQKGTFQKNAHIERKSHDGELLDDEYLVLFESTAERKAKQEQDPEWQKNNLEYDLRTTEWILEKVRASESYAQNLYAAMCNRSFVRNDVWPILKNERWSASWRSAGGIIADMQEKGDYIDWYCSGIGNSEDGYGLKGNKPEQGAYVPEGVVTEEINSDLRNGVQARIDNIDGDMSEGRDVTPGRDGGAFRRGDEVALEAGEVRVFVSR
jgi:hypothetical protein